MDIQALQSEVLAFCDERDRAQFHNPKDLATAISIEAGELQEKFLRKPAEESSSIGQQNPEVADELADIFKYILSFADACHIDLAEATLSKLARDKAKYPVDKVKGKADKYTKYQVDAGCKLGEKGYE